MKVVSQLYSLPILLLVKFTYVNQKCLWSQVSATLILLELKSLKTAVLEDLRADLESVKNRNHAISPVEKLLEILHLLVSASYRLVNLVYSPKISMMTVSGTCKNPHFNKAVCTTVAPVIIYNRKQITCTTPTNNKWIFFRLHTKFSAGYLVFQLIRPRDHYFICPIVFFCHQRWGTSLGTAACPALRTPYMTPKATTQRTCARPALEMRTTDTSVPTTRERGTTERPGH